MCKVVLLQGRIPDFLREVADINRPPKEMLSLNFYNGNPKTLQ